MDKASLLLLFSNWKPLFFCSTLGVLQLVQRLVPKYYMLCGWRYLEGDMVYGLQFKPYGVNDRIISIQWLSFAFDGFYLPGGLFLLSELKDLSLSDPAS